MRIVFNEYSLLLLVDDLNPTDNNFTNLLVTQLKMFPHARFVATCAESISKQCSLINFQDYAIEKFYIHDITYREVHQLTLSWPNISVEKKKKAEEKIIQILHRCIFHLIIGQHLCFYGYLKNR